MSVEIDYGFTSCQSIVKKWIFDLVIYCLSLCSVTLEFRSMMSGLSKAGSPPHILKRALRCADATIYI
jgi:hypothetical protein